MVAYIPVPNSLQRGVNMYIVNVVDIFSQLKMLQIR